MAEGCSCVNDTPRYATVTDYASLYSAGYFAHDAGASSFAQQVVPDLIARFCAAQSIDAVLDVGSGNGLFGSILRGQGLPCIDIDVMHRQDENFVRCDLSRNDSEAIARIKALCAERGYAKHLLTSFDMAEHVDAEHIGDFIYNVHELVLDDAIISVSTRPSSRANTFHSTILPIDTWKYLFSLVGLEATSFGPLQDHRSDQQFRSSSQELLAVASWQKRNIFHDDPSHQHYLHLRRMTDTVAPRTDVRNRVDAVLDIAVRTTKRRHVGGRPLPRLTYLVSFVQDWSFLRHFLDLWPAAQVQVILRRDFIAAGYADVIEAYLNRTGVAVRSIETVEQGSEALAKWRCGPRELFLTATEGLPTVLHGMASLITLDARGRGMTTATIQHGDLVPERTVHAAQFFLAMDQESVADFQRSTPSPAMCTPVALGAPKHLDSAIAPSDPDAIAFRLRSSAKHYRHRLLVGTNLHWLAHQGDQASVADWLTRASEAHPDILFLLRPHPDDWRSIDTAFVANNPNVLMLDDMTLLCIDWPLSRILRAVDGVISTHSTLVLDSLAAGTPTAILPTGITDQRLVDVQRRWRAMGAIDLAAEDLANGLLPQGWTRARTDLDLHAGERYDDFVSGLLALIDQPDDPAAYAAAREAVRDSFLISCRDLSLDSHPHANRQAVSAALDAFASAAD